MTFRARWVREGHYKTRPGSLASFKQTNQSAASSLFVSCCIWSGELGVNVRGGVGGNSLLSRSLCSSCLLSSGGGERI